MRRSDRALPRSFPECRMSRLLPDRPIGSASSSMSLATKGSLANVVVAETFPVELYRVRIKGARTAMPCWPVSAPTRCFDCTSSCRAVLAKPFV